MREIKIIGILHGISETEIVREDENGDCHFFKDGKPDEFMLLWKIAEESTPRLGNWYMHYNNIEQIEDIAHYYYDRVISVTKNWTDPPETDENLIY